jgi:selenocysteine lyase/cysteine desulfurase
VESIRAGLVFALKEQVGVQEIRRREQGFARRALASWSQNPNIDILGNTTTERLPIISFGLRHPPRLLHGNFVVAPTHRSRCAPTVPANHGRERVR